MTPPRPPHVVFMCGAAGSGKTTTARALEAEGFTRLSVDAEAYARGWHGVITREQAAVIDAELRERLGDPLVGLAAGLAGDDGQTGVGLDPGLVDHPEMADVQLAQHASPPAPRTGDLASRPPAGRTWPPAGR